MNLAFLVVGAYLLVGGVFIGWFRVARPGRLKRLNELKRSFGEKQGNIIHFVSYVVLQIGMGLFLLYRGLTGAGVL